MRDENSKKSKLSWPKTLVKNGSTSRAKPRTSMQTTPFTEVLMESGGTTIQRGKHAQSRKAKQKD
ncbi:hypothetical protein ACFXTO_008137 [Malus domestica]